METIFDAVEKAVPEEDRPILDDIAEQIQEYHAHPPRSIGNGKTVKDVHGFIQWVWLLQDGAASLPDRLPHSVLLLWRDRYISRCSDGRPSCPMPFRRCEDCKMVLPNEPEMWLNPCPVCGSKRIFHADFSKRLGVAWLDPRPGHNRDVYPG